MYGKDLTGLVLGKLTVLNAVEPIKRKHDGRNESAYRCRCECGVEKVYIRSNLTQTRNPYRSCGCVKSHSDPGAVKLQSAKRVYRGYRDGDLSFKDFLNLSQKLCYYCGAKPSNNHNEYRTKKTKVSKFAIKHGDFIYNGLDRKNNLLKHSKNNVVTCCSTCNWNKGKMSLREFKAWIRKVHAHLEKTKH